MVTNVREATEKVLEIVKQLKNLSNEDFVQACALTIVERSNTTVQKIRNFCGQVKHRRKTGAGSMDQCIGYIRPLSESTPAWKVDLIYRGDLVPSNGKLFMDVEKVSEVTTHRNVAATVAITDQNRELVFWCIIRRDNVCQFFPRITGLTKEKVASGMLPMQVKTLLSKVLRGNTVVGAAVQQDLESLNYDYQANDTSLVDKFFFQDSKGPFKLADLAQAFFPGKTDFQCGQHSAISDARMTVKIAKRMLILQAKGHKFYSEGIVRSSRAKIFNVGDKCTCRTTRKKYKKKPATRPDWREFDISGFTFDDEAEDDEEYVPC